MPLWNKKQLPSEDGMPVVRVQFRELFAPPDEGERSYAYLWPLKQRPKVGDRVWVSVVDDDEDPAVVVDFGRDGYRGELKRVLRLATPEEIARGF